MGLLFSTKKTNRISGGTSGNIISIGDNGELKDSGIPKSQLYQKRSIWGYQDFGAGVITTNYVTLTDNSNGISAPFVTADITGNGFIVRSDDTEKYCYTGTTKLFSTKIKINSITNDAVVLSGIPHSSYPIRIYYEILSHFYPDEYHKPKKILSPSALDELNPIIATQEELDTKLTKANNLNDLTNVADARNSLLQSASGVKGQFQKIVAESPNTTNWGSNVEEYSNANKPTNAGLKELYYNNDISSLEYWNGTAYKSVISNLVYSNYFSGQQTQILYTSSQMDIRWDGTNKQLQYYPKFSGWHDAGILFAKQTSISVNTDDISTTHNQWFYFTDAGILDANFNFGSFGSMAHMHIVPETFNSSYPVYRIVVGCGDNNSVWIEIYKIN